MGLFGDQAYSDNDFNSLKKVFHYYYDDFIFEADEDDFNIKITVFKINTDFV